LTAGSFDRRSLSAGRRQDVGPLSLDLAGAFEESDGHRPGTDYDMRTGRLAVRYTLDGGHLVAGELAHAVRKFGAGGFYGNYPSFETTRTTTGVLSGRLLAAGALLIEPSLRMRRNSDDFILYRDEPERYRNRHSTLQLGADLVARVPLSTRLSLAAGMHANRDEVESNSLGNHDETSTAFSFELSTERPGGLTGALGLRADRLPTGTTEFNPSASAAWWLHESLRIRSSVGRAFRAPTWTERYYRDPANEGSPDLSAEHAWSADAGVDFHPAPPLRFSASVFVREAENLIDWARDLGGAETIWRTRNVEDARFEGVEVEMELAEVAGTRVRASGYWLSVTSSAAPGFESKYALRPQVEMLSLSADRGVGPVELFVRGARERRSGEGHYLRLDGRASLWIREMRLFVDVRNATDEEYLDISQIPAAGRSLSVGLELRRPQR
jgi:iron complex outermembrane receptor protein